MPSPDHDRERRAATWVVIGRVFKQLADELRAERAALDAAPPTAVLFQLHEPPPEHAVTVEVVIGDGVSRTFVICSPSMEPGRFWVAACHRDPHGSARDGSAEPVAWSDVPAVVERLIDCPVEWARAVWSTTWHPPVKSNVWVAGMVDVHYVGAEEVIRRGL